MSIVQLLVVITTLLQTPAAAPAQSSAGNAENGKQLFMKNTCYYCHGTAGQGGAAGARIAAIGRNAQSFTRYVRKPSGQMPAYSETILSDQELIDIFAYVRSLAPAKPAADIPLLSAIK